METVSYYLEQLWIGIWPKGFMAACCTVYVDIFRGDVLMLDFYLISAGLDLALGMLIAHTRGNFRPKYLLYWVRKLMTYLSLVGIFGMICYAAHITTGHSLSLMNWVLFVCILTEVGSIIENAKTLGCPIPPPLDILLRLIRKHASKHIAGKLGMDERDRRDIEEAFAPQDETGAEPSRRRERDE